MSKKELVKRYILFIVCLFFMGLGIAMTKYAELGVSPISSLANVMSLKFTSVSFGMWLTATNILLLLGQIILLRKNFKLIQLMQIPLSFLFGYFTDLGMMIVSVLPNGLYIQKLALVLGGIVILAFGITLGVTADVILNSGEAFVKALSQVLHKDFGNTKIAFDVSWVTLSIILSLCFFDGKLLGTREGTVISAFLVGAVVKLFSRLLKEPITKLLKK